jgi:hypothetical protein
LNRTEELLGLFPPGTTQDVDGMLVIGGCRLDDVASRHGTPVLVVDEGALRDRVREYREQLAARWPDAQIAFASKAFPCTAVQRVMVAELNQIGLRPPASVIATTQEYFSEQDVFGAWLREQCDVEPGNPLPATLRAIA